MRQVHCPLSLANAKVFLFFSLLCYDSLSYGTDFAKEPPRETHPKIFNYKPQPSDQLDPQSSRAITRNKKVGALLLRMMKNRYCYAEELDHIDAIFQDDNQIYTAIETTIEQSNPHVLSVYLDRILKRILDGSMIIEIYHINAILEAGAKNQKQAITSVITWFIKHIDLPVREFEGQGTQEGLLSSRLNTDLDPFARSFWISKWDEGTSVENFVEEYKKKWGEGYDRVSELEKNWSKFITAPRNYVFGLKTLQFYQELMHEAIKDGVLPYNFEPETFLKFLTQVETDYYIPSLKRGVVIPKGFARGIRSIRCTPGPSGLY